MAYGQEVKVWQSCTYQEKEDTGETKKNDAPSVRCTAETGSDI